MQNTRWPLWKMIVFRFCFVYLALQISVCNWWEKLPAGIYLSKGYNYFLGWAVSITNTHVFHIKHTLVPLNGSSDTSYGWARLWLFISIACLATIVWSAVDSKRANYFKLNYWLCLFARYYLAFFAITYGIIKIFGFQMHFPHLYEMATPMGDLSPMQLSWLYIGFSSKYQAFAGLTELLAGVLLLYWRTATLGVIIATAAFINVLLLNLCYDIDAKVLSIQLVFTCLFLLANEFRRIIDFFIFQKQNAAQSIYQFKHSAQWLRITRIALKSLFILVTLIIPFLNCSWSVISSSPLLSKKPKQPLENGMYEVTAYGINKPDQPIIAADTLRWQDMILEDGTGSINTRDTTFSHWFNRAYFAYKIDTAKHLFEIEKGGEVVLSMAYSQPNINTIKLQGKRGNDSLFVTLKKSGHIYRLSKKEFHWLTEHEGDL